MATSAIIAPGVQGISQSDANTAVANAQTGSAGYNPATNPNPAPTGGNASPNSTPTYSPTVLSSANITENTIPDLQSSAANLPPIPSPYAANNQNNNTNSSGNSSGDTSSDSSGGSTGDPTADLFNGILGNEENQYNNVGNDSETQGELALINNMQTTADSLTSAQLSAITSTYEARESILQQSDASQTAAITSALTNAGATRYAPVSTQGILSLKEQSDITDLNNLQSEENGALLDVYKAQESDDMQLMSQKMDIYNSIRSDKLDLAKQINDTMVQANSALLDEQKQNEVEKQDSFNDTIATQNQKLEESKVSLQSEQIENEKQFQDESIGLQEQTLAIQKYQAEGGGIFGGSPSADSGISFDKTTGNITSSDGKSVLNVASVPGFTKMTNGSYFFDPTNPAYENNPGALKTAQAMAASAGIPLISSANIPSVQGLDTIQNLFTTLKSQTFGSQQYNNTYTALMGAVQGLSSKDPRLSALSNLNLPHPGLMGTAENDFNDITGGTGKIYSSAQNTINTLFGSLIPNYSAPMYGQTFNTPGALTQYAISHPEVASELNTLHGLGYNSDGDLVPAGGNVTPLTDMQISQIINGN